MKGIVFTLPNAGRSAKKADLRYYIRRYGKISLLAAVLLIGMIVGALTAKQAEKSVLDSLDFLFVTNFESRAEQTVFVTFSASLTSYFLFFAAIFLCGLSAWAIVGVPVILFFKGMGLGLCAGYLYQTYGFNGVGFYLLVMLVGVMISSIALLMQGKEAIGFSKSIWRMLRKNNPSYTSIQKAHTYPLFTYLINNSYILIAVAISALVDALLSVMFAGAFQF